MTTTEREKVIAKIQKLLALSTSPNEHEAKLAAQKASELMEAYQIAQADVLLNESEVESVVEELYTVQGQRMKLNWIYTLAHGSARLFDGEAVFMHGLWGTQFKFVGYPSDIEAMKFLFEHLYRSWFSIVEADLRDAKSKSYRPFQPRDTMKFKGGHGLAYADAIRIRCTELANRRKQAVIASGVSGTALIRSKDVALVTHIKAHYRMANVKHSSGSSDGRAYGHQAGSNIPLGGAIGGASGRKQLK